MRRDTRRRGFTLVEIMIVVAIIAILLTIAIPNMVRARLVAQEKTCISSLDKIEGGKEQCVMEHNMGNGEAVAWDDLVPTYVKEQPSCPSGGTYSIGTVGQTPTCTIAGHVCP